MSKTLSILCVIFLLIACNQKAKESKAEERREYSFEDVLRTDSTRYLSDSILEELRNPCKGPRKPIVTGQTKYIIVKSAYFNDIIMKRANAAILITDKDEIVKNEKLFFNNPQPYAHGCGFHYDIQFWDSLENLTESIWYNIECETYCFDNEEIRKRVEYYALQLKDNPTHYIYTLKINSKHTPSAVKKIFKNTDQIILIGGEDFYETKDSKYYDALLFDKSEDLNTIKEKLKKYNIIKEIKRYKENEYSNINTKPYEYENVEIKPEFRGGIDALRKYIENNIRQPAEAIPDSITNKRVVLKFVITPTGHAQDFIIIESINRKYDIAAISLIERMPLWKPGKHNGENVPVYVTIPVEFE